MVDVPVFKDLVVRLFYSQCIRNDPVSRSIHLSLDFYEFRLNTVRSIGTTSSFNFHRHTILPIAVSEDR